MTSPDALSATAPTDRPQRRMDATVYRVASVIRGGASARRRGLPSDSAIWSGETVGRRKKVVEGVELT